MATLTPKLTDRLMALDPPAFKAATQHPWLRLIGRGKLPANAELEWLQQDRIFAIGYVSFIGNLLAKVSIPTDARRSTSLEWRISDMLIEALVNIRRELAMFEGILRQHFDWGAESADRLLTADPQPNTQTRIYRQLFAAATAPNTPLLVGLATLWGTERCYLESWRFAKQQNVARSGPLVGDDVVRQVLIPNWTSPEFEAFVNDIASLLNELASRPNTTDADVLRCEEVWQQVLWCEERFWPEVEVEDEDEGDLNGAAVDGGAVGP